jgi:lipid II isoglutaminyl synthase (glutamine-hydrolysing)
MKYNLTITHLYPKEMNIYGDIGNIITLQKRCQWRDIDVLINNVGIGDNIADNNADIYFMGGGQDQDQFDVFQDLLKTKKSFIESEVNNNKVFLLICGGFQLFGEYFLDSSGRKIHGLQILPITTEAPGDRLLDRCLGNLVTEINHNYDKELSKAYPNKFDNKLVGFENHSGQTFFTNEISIQPLANVLIGKGNNAKQKIEGARYKNVFGSYSHGSFLPKNPHIADWLIYIALTNKYKTNIKLEDLDDSIEIAAHKYVVDKFVQNN